MCHHSHEEMGFSQLISVKNLPHLDIKSILTLLLEYPVKACLHFNPGLQLEAQREKKRENTYIHIYVYLFFEMCAGKTKCFAIPTEKVEGYLQGSVEVKI